MKDARQVMDSPRVLDAFAKYLQSINGRAGSPKPEVARLGIVEAVIREVENP
jgi:hypothetical protein